MIFDVAKHFHLCPAIVKPVDCVPQGIVDGDGEDKGFYIAVSYVIEKFNQAVIPFRQRAHPLKGLGSIIITAFELLPVVFHAAKLSGQEFLFVIGWGGRCIPEPTLQKRPIPFGKIHFLYGFQPCLHLRQEVLGLAGKFGVCVCLFGEMPAHNIRHIESVNGKSIHEVKTFQYGPAEHANELFLIYFLVVAEDFSVVPGCGRAEPDRILKSVSHMVESTAVSANKSSGKGVDNRGAGETIFRRGMRFLRVPGLFVQLVTDDSRMVVPGLVLCQFPPVFFDAVSQVVFRVGFLYEDVPAVTFVGKDQSDLSGGPAFVDITAQLSSGRMLLSLPGI